MDKKYGAYICTGCGIGDALDIEALNAAAKEQGMEGARDLALVGAVRVLGNKFEDLFAGRNSGGPGRAASMSRRLFCRIFAT